MKNLLILCVLCSLISTGCLWFSGQRPSVAMPAASVEILRPDLLLKSQTFFFEPFSAGDKAEASLQLDRMALFMVKGVSDALLEGASPLRLVAAEKSAEADLVLRGHIEEFSVAGGWKKVFFQKEQAVLVVRGELVSRATGDVVAVIYGRKKWRTDGHDTDQTAYQAGQDIGRKLLP
ncbi:MAG: hypothetical protein HQL19_07315 [Candidatus Omnitrophica bacterium]|nr:hypothetical protein [Candidatus Omnitrophota bacterium]